MTSLRILTFNVYGGYEFHERRLPFIIDSIGKSNADVICLQECTTPIVQQLIKQYGKYQTVWSKYLALLESFPECKEINDFSEKFAWEKPKSCNHLTWLFVIVNKEKLDVIEKELIYKGNWFDDGTLRVRLQSKSEPYLFDVYHVHFCGGSFGKPEKVLSKNRDNRIEEFQTLQRAIHKNKSNKLNFFVVCGDFNCDVDADHRNMFPETSLSPEFLDSAIVDAGKLFNLGATESTSKNLFRAWLKPGQQREARFDRILFRNYQNTTYLSDFMISHAELIGDKQVCAVTINKDDSDSSSS
eukprot:Pgem_evm1s8300